jgi:hypothetical protein
MGDTELTYNLTDEDVKWIQEIMFYDDADCFEVKFVESYWLGRNGGVMVVPITKENLALAIKAAKLRIQDFKDTLKRARELCSFS